jgi:hypothetical protein
MVHLVVSRIVGMVAVQDAMRDKVLGMDWELACASMQKRMPFLKQEEKEFGRVPFSTVIHAPV